MLVSGFEYIVVVVSWDRCSVCCCISVVTVYTVSQCSGFNAVQCNSIRFQISKAFNDLNIFGKQQQYTKQIVAY